MKILLRILAALWWVPSALVAVVVSIYLIGFALLHQSELDPSSRTPVDPLPIAAPADSPSPPPNRIWVHGYMREGKWVEGYWRG